MVSVSINMCMKISITSFGEGDKDDLIQTIYRDASNNSKIDNLINEPYDTRGPIEEANANN